MRDTKAQKSPSTDPGTGLTRERAESPGAASPLAAGAGFELVSSAPGSRLPILKTYKLFIGGKFPRSESGRYVELRDDSGKWIANLSAASRKDVRDAVSAARAAWPGWAGATAYLRGQILYRLAEVMEGRKSQLVDDELAITGADARARITREVELAIDRVVHYAGWADKYGQLFSQVNPVASPHFCFSACEPMGAVAIAPPERPGLLGLVSLLAPALVGGNTVVALSSTYSPLASITLAECAATSDLPSGVLNLLTGSRDELLPWLASHREIHALSFAESDDADLRRQEAERTEQAASDNLKRLARWRSDALAPSPYRIFELQEIKTTWHPIAT